MTLQQFHRLRKFFLEGVIPFIIIEEGHFQHQGFILLIHVSLLACFAENGIKPTDFRGFVSESDNRRNLHDHDDSHSYQPHRQIGFS